MLSKGMSRRMSGSRIRGRSMNRNRSSNWIRSQRRKRGPVLGSGAGARV